MRSISMRFSWLAASAALGLLAGSTPVHAKLAGAQQLRHGGHPPAGIEGTAGLDDRMLPQAGNGGYDVQHYDLDVKWDPQTHVLHGKAIIHATSLVELRSFNLDFLGFEIDSIRLNYFPVDYHREGQELTVTPSRTLQSGKPFRVEVRYHGVPQRKEGDALGIWGFMETDDGVLALAEPDGAPTWFPCNDHPSDKATFTIGVTLPNALKAVSNGVPGPVRRVSSTQKRYEWRERRPMATYLAMLAIGEFEVTTTTSDTGIPIINAVDPRLAQDAAPSLARLGEILDWEQSILGEYPFESAGAVVDIAPDIHYALETQSRPVYANQIDDFVLVHELAHQWFGNSVSVAQWQEIWLNEGFASYIEWLWYAEDLGGTTQDAFDYFYYGIPEESPFWSVAPGPDTLPDVDNLFHPAVYYRGAMTLHQLQLAVGQDAFEQILRTWVEENRNGNVTTQEFIALSEDLSGMELANLFGTWLHTSGKPTL